MRFTVFEQKGRPKPWGVRYWRDPKTAVRTYYATPDEANARKEKLEVAFRAGGLPAVLAIDEDHELAEAKRLAKESGESILALVRRGIAAGKRDQTGLTLREAFDGYMRRCAELKLRSTTVQFYTDQLDGFLAFAGETKRVSEITREKIRARLDAKPIASRPHALRAIRAWFRWMLRQDPPLVAADPTAGMALETPLDGRKLAFLSTTEAKALLTHSGPARPAVALMLFAGVRFNELFREVSVEGEDTLRWEDIDFKQRTVLVRSEVSKTRVTRAIRGAPQNLWKWLTEDRKESGPVCLVSLRYWLNTARTAAQLKPWGKSILRHTFASHHVAAYGDLTRTAVILRHEDDVKVLNRHYREGVTISKAEGLRYFALSPG